MSLNDHINIKQFFMLDLNSDKQSLNWNAIRMKFKPSYYFLRCFNLSFFMNFAESLPKNCAELCSKFKSKNVFQPLFTSLVNLLGKNASS